MCRPRLLARPTSNALTPCTQPLPTVPSPRLRLEFVFPAQPRIGPPQIAEPAPESDRPDVGTGVQHSSHTGTLAATRLRFVMERKSFRALTLALALFAVLGGIIAAAPVGLYTLGLSNVIGRPSPPASCHPTPTDRALLERTFRMSQPISIEPLSPWAYVKFILEDDSRDAAAGGVAATWLVAQHYNAQHLEDRRSIAWHLSGAALTIWITRHWSSDEVICAAVDRLRQSANSRPKS